MSDAPSIVDRWKEFEAALRWSRKVRSSMTPEEKARHWRETMKHLRAYLGQPPVAAPEPEQLDLLNPRDEH
jgi:hypothetical protein